MSTPSFTYRRAGIEDAADIERIATEIWNEHYISIISQEQIDYMLELMYSEKKLIEQMQRGCEFTMVYVEGKLSGYISIEEQKDKPGEYFLHKFYIHSNARGLGLGEKLFNKVFEEKSDTKAVRLFVNRENYKSVNFYFKMGFTIESVINQHIGNGFYMNDFVMVKRFNGEF